MPRKPRAQDPKTKRRSGLNDEQRDVVVKFLQSRLPGLADTVKQLRAAQHVEGGEWAKATADYYEHAGAFLNALIAQLHGSQRRPTLLDRAEE